MNFKTKDLMVTVLPKVANPEIAKLCMLHTHICLHPTINCHGCSIAFTNPCGLCSFYITRPCGFCSLQFSCLQTNGCGFNSCGPGGSACDPTIFCAGSQDPWVIEHLEDLVALRAELQDTLKQLDVIQKEGLSSGITSKAEATALEQSLTAALDQVRSAKKNLK